MFYSTQLWTVRCFSYLAQTVVNVRMVWKINAAIWLFSALLAFLPIHMGWNTADGRVQNIDHQFGSFSCVLEVNRLYAVLVAFGTYFGPLLVMAAIYFRVLKITRQQVISASHADSNIMRKKNNRWWNDVILAENCSILFVFEYFASFICSYRSVNRWSTDNFEEAVCSDPGSLGWQPQLSDWSCGFSQTRLIGWRTKSVTWKISITSHKLNKNMLWKT